MATLYDLIYDFMLTYIFSSGTATGSQDFELRDLNFTIGSDDMLVNMQQWLCHTASIISIIIILVLCCLFVYKIIKLIGGLIR